MSSLLKIAISDFFEGPLENQLRPKGSPPSKIKCERNTSEYNNDNNNK